MSNMSSIAVLTGIVALITIMPAIGFHEVHPYIVKDYLHDDGRKAVRQHGDRRAVTTAGRKADAARPALTIPRRRDVRATL